MLPLKIMYKYIYITYLLFFVTINIIIIIIISTIVDFKKLNEFQYKIIIYFFTTNVIIFFIILYGFIYIEFIL